MDKLQEIWKDVMGYEGLYQVSDQGRVKNIAKRARTSVGRLVSSTTDTWGYPKLLLSKQGEAKLKRIHRLVALAFIPNPQNKPEVNHKNRNKRDNSVDNLEWATRKEQEVHKHLTAHLVL